MGFTSICLVFFLQDLLTPHAATLSVSPEKSQFFKYDYIPLKCVANSSGWEVKRMVKNHILQKCERGWGIPEESSCIIVDAFPADTGAYWCESQAGERSDKINITVIDYGVILESPLHPVLEGDNVTLRCFSKRKGDDNIMTDFPSSFFKNGEFIGEEKLGRMTLKSVSKSYDEGFYKCKHPSNGESKESWLEVTERAQQNIFSTLPPTRPPPPAVSLATVICGVLLFILYNIIFILCVYKYRKWARARANAKRAAASMLN